LAPKRAEIWRDQRSWISQLSVHTDDYVPMNITEWRSEYWCWVQSLENNKTLADVRFLPAKQAVKLLLSFKINYRRGRSLEPSATMNSNEPCKERGTAIDLNWGTIYIVVCASLRYCSTLLLTFVCIGYIIANQVLAFHLWALYEYNPYTGLVGNWSSAGIFNISLTSLP
jgi:hypothetical protein